MAIRLYDKSGGHMLGEIKEEELQYLIDQMEEESSKDKDYFIDFNMIEILKENGAGTYLIDILEKAIAASPDGVDVAWECT